MLPVKIIEFPDSHEEQLLQDVATCKTNFKLAPAYTLYLCALHRSIKAKSNLVEFLKKAAMVIYNKIENLEDKTEEVFWLANASELLHFFKYDVNLSKNSESAQSILIITIQNIFHNLLTYFIKCINSAASDCNYLDKTMDAINNTTAAFQHFGVNVAFVNQLLSFFLQWMCDKLISKIEDPPSCYEYFNELQRLAKLMDDECLLSKVMKFALLENTSQNVQDTNSVSYITLKRQPANFLKNYHGGNYTTLIEKAARLMAQIKGGKTRPNDDVIKLQLVIPYNGYSYQYFRGIPIWLNTFLNLIHDNGWCTLERELNSPGYWNFCLKERKVERCCLTNIQFRIQSSHNMFKAVHVTGLSPAVSSLAVGDVILSVNGNTLTNITQRDLEDVLTRFPSGIKLEVFKIDKFELYLQTAYASSTSYLPPDMAHAEEVIVHNETVKFNLLENKVNSEEDLSESICDKQEDFFANIKKEVEELDSMLKNFCGNSENDRSYEYMKEIMMRNIIKLDNMDTGNNQVVRKRRRDTIYLIQEKIEQLNAKLTSNQEKAKAIIEVDRDVYLDRKVFNDGNSAGAKGINTALPNKESKNCASRCVKSTNVLKNQQIRGSRQLIFETKYCLNELATKFVSTGIYASSEHNVPAVKFSIGKIHIVLGMEDWHALLGFEHLLREHFRNENKYQKDEVFASYRLHFVTSSHTKFVRISDKTDSIFLDQESVDNLLQLSSLISKRMNLIKSICFDNFFQSIITSIAASSDPLVTLQKLIDSQANNIDPLISYLIMEYIEFYSAVITKSVEMKRRCRYTEL